MVHGYLYKSQYLATEQWTAVRPRTCRPTSPASLMCHLDWDSDHLTLTKWLCHPSTSLPSAGGPSQFSPLICGIVSRHTSPHHRRSRFSGSVSRLFFFSVLILILLPYLTSYCGPGLDLSNFSWGVKQPLSSPPLPSSSFSIPSPPLPSPPFRSRPPYCGYGVWGSTLGIWWISG